MISKNIETLFQDASHPPYSGFTKSQYGSEPTLGQVFRDPGIKPAQISFFIEKSILLVLLENSKNCIGPILRPQTSLKTSHFLLNDAMF